MYKKILTGSASPHKNKWNAALEQVVPTLSSGLTREVSWAAEYAPRTVVHDVCQRSVGGRKDYYSEGDYWWPNPEQPDDPYIRRDGMTNPDLFYAHREALITFSRVIGVLSSQYLLSGDIAYARIVEQHLRAWFVDPDTRMNPSLNYTQAIKGKCTGRGIGLIDTVHLAEVVQSVRVLACAGALDDELVDATREWVAQYLHWFCEHPFGKEEMDQPNNHGTWWTAQAAVFALFTKDTSVIDFCRDRYTQILLPGQMAADGSFPAELERTKPYGYSLFNLDGMVLLCRLLAEDDPGLWFYRNERGAGLLEGIEYIVPYVRNKNAWPYKKDVMYWNEWPVAQPFLLFGAIAFQRPEWLDLWSGLEHFPSNFEVLRNLPVRNPRLWL